MDKNEIVESTAENASNMAPQARGVTFDILPPSTSTQNSQVSNGGEDTARVSLWVTFDPKRFEELGRALDEVKTNAQNSGNDASMLIGNTTWEVHKSGFHLGSKGKGGPYFRWQLRYGGIRLGLANRWSALKQHGACNVWLEIGSEVLMVSGGLKPVFHSCVEIIGAMGGRVNADTLSEVHVCADLPEVDLSEFTERFDKMWYVCRAKRRSKHCIPDDGEGGISTHGYGLQPTGFIIGTAITLCVYEKRIEVNRSITKKAIMEKLRWGGPVDKAVRVEFKLHRKPLKQRGINAVADWEEKKAGMIQWLCEDWFRMTEGEVDRTNTSRAKTWHTWRIVQSLFQDWAGKGAIPPVLGLGIHLNPKSLVQQAAGCLTQAMALRGMDSKSMNEFTDAATRLLRGYVSFDDISVKLEKKFATLSAHSPRRAFFSWGR